MEPFINAYKIFLLLAALVLIILLNLKKHKFLTCILACFFMLAVLIFPFRQIDSKWGEADCLFDLLETGYNSLQIFGADGELFSDDKYQELIESNQQTVQQDPQESSETNAETTQQTIQQDPQKSVETNTETPQQTIQQDPQELPNTNSESSQQTVQQDPQGSYETNAEPPQQTIQQDPQESAETNAEPRQDADLSNLQKASETDQDKLKNYKWFITLYRATLSLLYFIAPVLAGGYALNFIKPIKSHINRLHRLHKETFLFSEPSEKALDLADNLQNSEKNISIIFYNVKRDDFGFIFSKGFIPFQKKITEFRKDIFMRIADIISGHKPYAAVFLSDNEEKNMENTVYFVSKNKDDREPMFLYTFSTRPEAELLLNFQKTGNLACRLISETNATVLRNITANREMFDPKKKDIYILIVGFGSVGSGLLNALLWAYAWTDRILNIEIIDNDDTGVKEEYFYRLHPGLREKRQNTIFSENGNYIINIAFTNKDIRKLSPEDLINADKIQRIYLAVGNDADNIEYAIYLRQAFSRYQINKKVNANTEHSLPVIEVVLKKLKDNNLNLKDSEENEYHIRAFTGNDGYYTANTLLDIYMEVSSFEEHLVYLANKDINNYRKAAGSGSDGSELRESLDALYYKYKIYKKLEEIKSKSLNTDSQKNDCILQYHNLMSNIIKGDKGLKIYSDFYKHDYNVRSSRAKAVFSYIHENDEVNKTIEHLRWHAFMLSEGYQYADPNSMPAEDGDKKKTRDHIAKLHTDMTDEVSEANKEKDCSVSEQFRLVEGILKDHGYLPDK